MNKQESKQYGDFSPWFHHIYITALKTHTLEWTGSMSHKVFTLPFDK